MTVCPQCGARNAQDEQFCGACGTYLEWEEGAPAPEGDAEPPLVEEQPPGHAPGAVPAPEPAPGRASLAPAPAPATRGPGRGAAAVVGKGPPPRAGARGGSTGAARPGPASAGRADQKAGITEPSVHVCSMYCLT